MDFCSLPYRPQFFECACGEVLDICFLFKPRGCCGLNPVPPLREWAPAQPDLFDSPPCQGD